MVHFHLFYFIYISLIFFLETQPHLSLTLVLSLKVKFTIPELTYWALSVGMTLLSVLLPCKPPLLGALILCRMRESSPIPKLLIGLLLAGLEFVMTMQTIVSGFGI